jgi:hypothetical protein
VLEQGVLISVNAAFSSGRACPFLFPEADRALWQESPAPACPRPPVSRTVATPRGDVIRLKQTQTKASGS